MKLRVQRVIIISWTRYILRDERSSEREKKYPYVGIKTFCLLRANRIGPAIKAISSHCNSPAPSCFFVLPASFVGAEVLIGDGVAINPVKRI